MLYASAEAGHGLALVRLHQGLDAVLQRLDLVRHAVLLDRVDAEAQRLTDGQPGHVHRGDELPDVELQAVVVVLVLLPDENDKIEVVPDRMVSLLVPAEPARLGGGAVKRRALEAADEAVLQRVLEPLLLLAAQLAKGVDDDTEDDVHQHQKDDHKVGKVDEEPRVPRVRENVADAAAEAEAVHERHDEAPAQRPAVFRKDGVVVVVVVGQLVRV
mmetsp:Transcript_16155/g.54492  ORF Transcript_16155/g.54492 Transcript_16155/m.54492 type:complete len:215 (+) Transcript_16155:749-1393(+)